MKGYSRFLSILLLLTPSVLFCFSNESFRLRGIGQELRWIVNDRYTNIFINPAELNLINKNHLFTNLSNLSGSPRRILDPDQIYQNESGAFLIGTFYRMRSFNLGVMAEIWKDRQWATGTYRMPYPFSDYHFNWTAYSNQEGSWLQETDNGTVENIQHGHSINSDGQGINFQFLFSRKSFGLAYQLIYSRPPDLPYHDDLYHYYKLTEGGPQPIESIEAIQTEKNDPNSISQIHRLNAGFILPLKNNDSLDFTAGLSYYRNNQEASGVKTKEINYDPDNDQNTPFSTNYYQYYLRDETKTDNRPAGLGIQTGIRYSKKLQKELTLRMTGMLSYQPAKDSDYSISNNFNEIMLDVNGNTLFSTHDSSTSEGTRTQRDLLGSVTAGAAITPVPRVTAGLAIRYEYERFNRKDDLDQKKNEIVHRYHRLILPAGGEYRPTDKLALRLGTVSIWQAHRYENDVFEVGEPGSHLYKVNAKGVNSRATMETRYSYGLGYRINSSLQFDFTGITDLTEISSLLLSVTIYY
ncbi:MAG: hypothetical protein WAN36_01055 [Calditrichia bacterium]